MSVTERNITDTKKILTLGRIRQPMGRPSAPGWFSSCSDWLRRCIDSPAHCARRLRIGLTVIHMDALEEGQEGRPLTFREACQHFIFALTDEHSRSFEKFL